MYITTLLVVFLNAARASDYTFPTDIEGFRPKTLNRNKGLDFFYLQASDNCDSPLDALKGSDDRMQCELDMNRGFDRAAGLGIFMPNYYGIRIESLCFSVKNVDRIFIVPGYFIFGMDGPNVELTVNNRRRWVEVCVDPFPGQEEFIVARFMWIHFYVDDPNASRKAKVRDLEMKAVVRPFYFYTETGCAYYDTYGECLICFSYSFDELGQSIYEHGCYSYDYFYYN